MSAEQAYAKHYQMYERERRGFNRAPRPDLLPEFDALLAHSFRVDKMLKDLSRLHRGFQFLMTASWEDLFSRLSRYCRDLRHADRHMLERAGGGTFDETAPWELYFNVIFEAEGKGWALRSNWKEEISNYYDAHPEESSNVAALLTALYHCALAWPKAVENVKANHKQILSDFETSSMASSALANLNDFTEDRHTTAFCPTTGLPLEEWNTLARAASDVVHQVKESAKLNPQQQDDLQAALCAFRFIAELATRHARQAALQPSEDGSISTTGNEDMLRFRSASTSSSMFEPISHRMMSDLIVKPANPECRNALNLMVEPMRALILATRAAGDKSPAESPQRNRHDTTGRPLQSLLDGVSEVPGNRFSSGRMTQSFGATAARSRYTA